MTIYLINVLRIACFCYATILAASPLYSEVYCGVYSISAAGYALGKTSNFESFLTEEYVGRDGSSVDQLLQAAGKLELEATGFSGLGVVDLQLASTPILMHVRESRHTPLYNHWIVFLGLEGRFTARVYDPNVGIIRISVSELCARWDGVGIATALRAADIWLFRSLGWLVRFGILVVITAVVIGDKLVGRSQITRLGSNYLKESTVAVAIVLATAFLAGGVFDLAFSSSMFNRSSHAALWTLHNPADVSDFSQQDLIRWKSDSELRKSIVFVDSRRANSYAHGTIPGAISLPIDSTSDYEERVQRDWQPDTPIVVFCQSQNCDYAHIVAARLTRLGQKNVKIYREGFAGWKTLSMLK